MVTYFTPASISLRASRNSAVNTATRRMMSSTGQIRAIIEPTSEPASSTTEITGFPAPAVVAEEARRIFALVNWTSSHESRAHGNVENTRNDPGKMKLHSYHHVVA